MSLDTVKHIRYFTFSSQVLQRPYQAESSQRLALAHFVAASLDLLGRLPALQAEQQWDKWVMEHLVSPQGFRGSMAMQQEPNGDSPYDPPTIAGTYAALCLLAELRSDLLGSLDRAEILRYVAACQQPDGSFVPFRTSNSTSDISAGENDLRYVLMAVSIRYMLYFCGGSEGKSPADIPVGADINVAQAAAYIRSARNYDGGFGLNRYGESHAGMTFCAVAALRLLGELHGDWIDGTVEWLVMRHKDSGGVNGRVNKPADTCYAFWVLGALRVLGKDVLDTELLRDFLLQRTQHSGLGGFGKVEGDLPDVFHSFLGLCAVSLCGNAADAGKLEAVVPELVISAGAMEFLSGVEWRS